MKTKFLCFMVVLIFLIQCPMRAHAKTEYDFTESSNVTSETLENALYHDLKWYADTFIECEEKHGVNAVMLASIAALESGWGESDIAKDTNNLFGWKDEDGEYMKFYSRESCIRYVSKAISEKYLNEDGDYYTGGTTVRHISELYCNGREWEKEVNNLIYDILWRCENENSSSM